MVTKGGGGSNPPVRSLFLVLSLQLPNPIHPLPFYWFCTILLTAKVGVFYTIPNKAVSRIRILLSVSRC